MKRGDMAIIAIILIALTWWGYSAFGNSHSHARETTLASIYVNGELYKEVELTEEAYELEIRSERGYNLLKVSNYGIEMIESDCPDHICIGFGHIHAAHENIVCLPNRIFVEIQSGDEAKEVDAIVS